MLSETAIAEFCYELFFLPWNGSELNSESLFLFLFQGTKFQVVFSSAKGFWREFQELASIFYHRTEFRVVFSSAKGFEGNSKNLLLFLFRGTKFRVVFSSVEGFGTEFREFSVPVCNNHLFRLFRLPRNYFYVRNSQPYLRGFQRGQKVEATSKNPKKWLPAYKK